MNAPTAIVQKPGNETLTSAGLNWLMDRLVRLHNLDADELKTGLHFGMTRAAVVAVLVTVCRALPAG